MAKKLITKGVDSSVIVKNLNSQYFSGCTKETILPLYSSFRSNTGVEGWLITTNKSNVDSEHHFQLYIGGHMINSSYEKPINTYVSVWYYNKSFKGYCYHNGYNIGNIHIFFYNNKICLWIQNPIINVFSNLYVTNVCYANGNIIPFVESIEVCEMPTTDIQFKSIIKSEIAVHNQTGNAFEVVDLPDTVSTLDIDTLPPIANVGTIILRYNGVVQDLDTYLSQDDNVVMPLPMSDGIEVNAEMPSTLELTPGIMPMVNLDDYVGATKGYLRIYVPHRYIYDYRERYPKLSAFFFKLTTRVPYDIMIGGVNLLKNTKTFNGWTLERDEYIVDGYNDLKAVSINVDIDETGDIYRRLDSHKVKLEYDSYYTISFYGKGSKIVFLTSNVAFCVNHNCRERGMENGNNLFQAIEMTSEWKRYYITYLTSSSLNGSNTFDGSISMRVYNHDNATICGLKLEKGFIPSEWTPALEDIESDFREVYETIETEKEDIEETYAKKDGAYEGLLAGTALNLQGQHDVINDSMYRPTAGTLDINWEAAEIEGIQGNSIAWNQLVKNGNFADGTDNWRGMKGTFSVNENEGVLTTTEDDLSFYRYQHYDFIKDHTYLLVSEFNSSNDITALLRIVYNNHYKAVSKKSNEKWEKIYIIQKVDEDIIQSEISEYNRIDISVNSNLNDKSVRFRNVQLFDLTLIYGMGKEPTTLEQFEEDYQKWFGKRLTYEEYDEGSLRNVQATGIKTVGYNLSPITEYDGGIGTTWTNRIFLKNDFGYKGQFYISYIIESSKAAIDGNYVKPGFTFHYTDGSTSDVLSISSNGRQEINGISNKNKIVEYICGLFNTYGYAKLSNICFNMVWSGSREGEYEPHWEETRSLPLTTLTGKLNGEGESVVIFPDGMKRAFNIYNNVYDFINDEIIVDNGITKAIKRIGSVDLGTLIWSYQPEEIRFNSNIISDMYNRPEETSDQQGTHRVHLMNGKYEIKYMYRLVEGDKLITSTNKVVRIRDNSFNGDIDSFKQSLQGVILYYELAEPEVYIVDDFQLPLTYRVDDYGTEQVVSPEGTVNPYLITRYGVNAVDTIRRLPQNYVSEKSINNLLSQLNSVMNGTWTKIWNDITNSYDFSFVPNEVPDSSQPNEELP